MISRWGQAEDLYLGTSPLLIFLTSGSPSLPKPNTCSCIRAFSHLAANLPTLPSPTGRERAPSEGTRGGGHQGQWRHRKGGGLRTGPGGCYDGVSPGAGSQLPSRLRFYLAGLMRMRAKLPLAIRSEEGQPLFLPSLPASLIPNPCCPLRCSLWVWTRRRAASTALSATCRLRPWRRQPSASQQT